MLPLQTQQRVISQQLPGESGVLTSGGFRRSVGRDVRRRTLKPWVVASRLLLLVHLLVVTDERRPRTACLRRGTSDPRRVRETLIRRIQRILLAGLRRPRRERSSRRSRRTVRSELYELTRGWRTQGRTTVQSAQRLSWPRRAYGTIIYRISGRQGWTLRSRLKALRW